MIDLDKTAMHRVYRTEAIRQTLIVSLQGDAVGFGSGAVHTEMMTLLNVARHPDLQNLIVDMSGNNYFGSLVLGEIVKLGQAVRERGGRVALCGVSRDMEEILRIMKLDTMWERYPTRASAIQAVAGIGLGYRLKPLIKPAAIVAAILLLAGVYFIIPRKDPVREDYQVFAQLWREGRSLQESQPSETDWLRFTKKASKRTQAIVDHLKSLDPMPPAAISLFIAARDHVPQALEHRLNSADPNTLLIDYFLARAEAELDGKPLPDRPKNITVHEVPAAESTSPSETPATDVGQSAGEAVKSP